MRISGAVMLLSVLGLAGCEQPAQQRAPAPSPAVTTSASPLTPASRAQAESLKQLGDEWLSQLKDCTVQLEADTKQFLGVSTDANLENVKQMLHTCHSQYQGTELLLGVTPEQQAAMLKVRHNIASPLELPGYIDSIEGYPGSGIVNDTSLTMSEATLREQQGLTAEDDVSLGFDVIAFLVWGEQRFNSQLPERPLKDLSYVGSWDNARTDLPISEHPQNRRRLYLQLATTLLKLDCDRLLAVWRKGPLPRSEKEARDWQLGVLQKGLTLLEQYPGNSDVPMALNQWLNRVSATAANQSTDGAMTVATDPAQLRDEVQQAINSLLTTRG